VYICLFQRGHNQYLFVQHVIKASNIAGGGGMLPTSTYKSVEPTSSVNVHIAHDGQRTSQLTHECHVVDQLQEVVLGHEAPKGTVHTRRDVAEVRQQFRIKVDVRQLREILTGGVTACSIDVVVN